MTNYWDIIYEIIRKIDNEGLHIYVNSYPLGEDEEKEILVFDDTNSSKEFNELLKEAMKDIPEVIQAKEDTIYDVDARDEWYLDLATGDSWTYYDEGFVCDDCGRWFYYDYYGATSYANYMVGDGYIVCEHCMKENDEYKEEYLADKLDNPKNANTIFTMDELYDMGFDKVNEWPYANGWYGQVDDPKKVYEKAKELYPDDEFMFSIRKNYNPFETEFDLYKREVA